MFENYYLKSNLNTFLDKKYFNSNFISHLNQIKKLFGENYMKIYKNNAINFVNFYLDNKERFKKNNNNNKNNLLE